MSKPLLTIEAGKFYKTIDGQIAFCTAVELPPPEGWYINPYIVCMSIESNFFSVTTKGKEYSSGTGFLDIISEWAEPVETRTFKSPKQLAKALLKGQKWKAKTCNYYCYWDNVSHIFKVGSTSMSNTWNYADGKTIWTRVKD